MTAELWGVLFSILLLPVAAFFVVVLLGYFNNKDLNRGEMRRAIAAFLIVLFGLLVAVSFFPINLALPAEIKGLFAGAVTTIIGFYFGFRARSSQPGEGQNPSASGGDASTGS